MTASELEKAIREQLEKDGLWQLVDQRKSQFLEFPDGLFAEIVLGDGSELAAAESVVRELRESLEKQGIELDAIVRSTWTVQNVGDPRPAISVTGGIRAAWSFPATLVSGDLTKEIEVDVTMLAVDAIKRKVKESVENVDEKAAMKEVVKEFLKLELSFGGESYWDPMRYPKQELNDSALLYLFGHSPVGQR
jgi:hypothetical protein